MWNGQLNQLRFCDGSQRYVFKEELTILANSRYTKVEKISVVDNAQEFKITYSNGTVEINNLIKVLQVRPENNGLEIDPVSTTDGEGGLGNGNGGDDEPSSGDGGFQVSYFVYDHLENTRIVYHTVLDCNESEVNYVLEHAVDYYPYGKVLREYTNCEEARYLTTQHERDQETGLDYRGARFYDSDIGRFLSLDPKAGALPSWSPYAYGLNNPILMIDPDGQYPWPFHIRSFISTPTTGGGVFRGDCRGPSTASYPDAWSRVRSTFTVDPAQSYVSDARAVSDPTASISNRAFGEGSASFDFHHFGKDPITPGFLTPNLDVHSSFSVTEDLENGILSIFGSFTGDKFPSTEAFVVDQSGNTKVFLGAKMEAGGLHSLFGDNKKPLFNVNMQIMFDSDGNFTGVRQGDQMYSVENWNKKVQDEF